MNHFIKGITYSYNRNIGWQDQTIRTILGIAAAVAAIFLYKTNFFASILLGVFAFAQFGTVLSAKCIICYFAGQCTIDGKEKKSLRDKGIPFEK